MSIADRYPLRPTVKQSIPEHHIFVDTETYQVDAGGGRQEHHLKLGVACYTRYKRGVGWTDPDWITFCDLDTWYNWVESWTADKRKVHVWAHNMDYDFRVLTTPWCLRDRGWSVKSAILERTPFIVTFARGSRKLSYVSTTNLYPMPLASVAQAIGMQKGDWQSADQNDADLERYCRNDVDIIRRAIAEWVDLLVTAGLGSMKLSLAGQALEAYRYGYLDQTIYVDTSPRAIELSRCGYYGGRTECYRVGAIDKRLWMLDVNSMYPYVMRQYDYPTALRGMNRQQSPRSLARLMKRYSVIADVTVNTDKPRYPKRWQSRLVFPVGRFRTILPHPELMIALEHGSIERIHRVAYYDSAPLFREYVDDLYRIRREYRDQGNAGYSLIVKLLMNSLYGKFGQSGVRWETVEESDTWDWTLRQYIDHTTGDVIRERQLGELIQRQQRKAVSGYAHPVVAATVTSYARAHLLSLIETAGWDHVYYCDTDSVLVDWVGYGHLRDHLDEQRLGALGVVGEYDGADLRGPKDYRLGETEKIKGIRRDAIRIDDATYRQLQWSTSRGNLAAGTAVLPVTQYVTKRLHREYLKGDVQPDGRVTPYQADGPGWLEPATLATLGMEL